MVSGVVMTGVDSATGVAGAAWPTAAHKRLVNIAVLLYVKACVAVARLSGPGWRLLADVVRFC
jgi:hypothetical protein